MQKLLLETNEIPKLLEKYEISEISELFFQDYITLPKALNHNRTYV